MGVCTCVCVCVVCVCVCVCVCVPQYVVRQHFSKKLTKNLLFKNCAIAARDVIASSGVQNSLRSRPRKNIV